MKIKTQGNLEKTIVKKKISQYFNKLIIGENEEVDAILIDNNRNKIKCSFNYGGCVELDTYNYSYLSLSFQNIKNLQRLMLDTDLYFSHKYENDK